MEDSQPSQGTVSRDEVAQSLRRGSWQRSWQRRMENGIYRSDCGDQPAEMKGEGIRLSQKQGQADVADQRTRGGCRLCLLVCRTENKSCKGAISFRRRQSVLSTLSGTTYHTFHNSSDKQTRADPWTMELLCGDDREQGPGRTAISFLRQFSLWNQGYSGSHYVGWL